MEKGVKPPNAGVLMDQWEKKFLQPDAEATINGAIGLHPR